MLPPLSEPSSPSLPFLTRDFPGVGGSIKQRPEDFFVQELPLYEPSGEGEHVYVEIQKVGLATFEAIDRIAAALDVSPRDIGYAGMKDARAVTRQMLSISGTTPEAVMGLKLPGITVHWAVRHGEQAAAGAPRGQPLRHQGPRRQPDRRRQAPAGHQDPQRRGLPNYFGEQRFGRRGDNDLLGAAFIRGDDSEVLHAAARQARCPPSTTPRPRRPAQAFDRGTPSAP